MKVVNLNVTLCEDTAQSLQRAAEELGLTVGEVLDRFTVERAVTDPVQAALLLAELVITYTCRLSPEDREKAIRLLKKMMSERVDPEDIQSDRWDMCMTMTAYET